MKVIVAGSRSFDDYGLLCEVMYQLFAHRGPGTAPDYQDLILISGTARGADRLGMRWARDRHIPIYKYPADWDRHGPAAGPIRNREMAADGDVLVAFWDGESRGTKNMIHEAVREGLEVHVYQWQE